VRVAAIHWHPLLLLLLLSLSLSLSLLAVYGSALIEDGRGCVLRRVVRPSDLRRGPAA
jgi:hypothetical protein